MTAHLLTYTDTNPDYSITLPLSKSISNRVLLINSLSEQPAKVDYAVCDDSNSMLAAINSTDEYINIGAAGTAMRFLTAFFATRTGRMVTLDGSERMRQRPIAPLVDALRSIGADIEYTQNEGFPPLKITGKILKGGDVTINAGISSQFISALMMIAPTMEKALTIHLAGVQTSRPYIEMTAEIMRKCGAEVILNEEDILISTKKYVPENITIEADWSAASYWYEIAALTRKNVHLSSLTQNSLQGDSGIKEIFEKLGVTTVFNADGTADLVSGEPQVSHLEIDLGGMPDTAQTFAVTLCIQGISYKISGLGTLPRKETDRLAALVNELKKVGYVLKTENADTLIWDGTKTAPVDEPVKTYKDHRMAMCFAPAVFTVKSIKIEDIAVVSKSYPDFWKDVAKAGIMLAEI